MAETTIDSVIIGGITYPVERVAGLNNEGTKLDGWVKFRPFSIQLDNALGRQGERVVLWHEVLHAILSQTGHEDLQNETLLDALAYGIVQVLNDNPGLR